MTYNQLRANIRNLLCGATRAEMQAWLEDAALHGRAESVEYAEEFIREIDAEDAEYRASLDPAECSGDHYPLACTD